MDKVTNLLLNHVSVRKYEDKPISREVVDRIIKCAQMAPTSSHFQAYSIIEVRDPRKREMLAEVAGGQEWIIKAPLVLLFCGDLHRGSKYFKDIDMDIFSNTELYTVATVDASLSAQKALIAAQTMGLGGVFVGGIRNNVEKVSIEFKLPNLVFPLYALCIGYPKNKNNLKPRLPQAVVHKIDYYDENKDAELMIQYDNLIEDYYIKRTNGQEKDTWTERCGKLLMKKPRYEVGHHFRKKGLLKK